MLAQAAASTTCGGCVIVSMDNFCNVKFELSFLEVLCAYYLFLASLPLLNRLFEDNSYGQLSRP